MRWFSKIVLLFVFLLLVSASFFYIRYQQKEKPLTVITGNISQGDTIADILTDNNISTAQSYEIINALKKVFDVRKCNIGDKWEIVFDKNQNFVKFTYQNGPLDYYTVTYDSGIKSYNAEKNRIEAEKKLLGVKGEICSSLYESMVSLGVNPEIIIQFAEIFSSKIDFFTDCQNGDEFSVLWESYIHNNEILKDIRIVTAKYKNSGDTYFGFYFETPDGKKGYYDKKGKSVESSFLRAPLNYRRISSYFSYKRFHPILKIYRPHLGIDYAAPKGTPISTIGDGKVIFSGWLGGYGKTVKIRHPNGYVSYYGHLSRIQKGVKTSSRVRKGQVIGYVGSTGLSTGPHLDFRVQSGGKFINFLRLKFQPSYPLPKKYLPEFEKVRFEMLEKLVSLEKDKIKTFENMEEKEIKTPKKKKIYI